MTHATGAILIGASETRRDETLTAIDPSTGRPLDPAFSCADESDVERACALADAAFAEFSESPPDARAQFLERAADNIAALGDALTERAALETGLPRARLEGERARTVGQLRMFAEVVRQGDWLHAVIDPALAERQPAPPPDLRRRHVALGPVAVFGASNFPIAFSVAGGDTASALAAGCSVVVKGHPAHPGTGELVARAVRSAVDACGLHEGVFSYLPGDSHALGGALVGDPRIKAVGFTGSHAGGIALQKIAMSRPEPIPVYAEMSSINPVILLPAALKARGPALAADFIRSMTLGAGQFCTNPGLVIAIAGADLEAFAADAAAVLSKTSGATMLTPGIRRNFESGVAALTECAGLKRLASGLPQGGAHEACGALFMTDAATFRLDRRLGEEVFGAASIIVACRDLQDVARLIESLEGQLTITFHMDDADEGAAAALLPRVARKAGRIIANGWPTGVEVCHAMVHGGPFPATSDVRATSVGALAIERFLRPVCYQDFPDTMLPPALQNANPWNIRRRINGKNAPAD